LGPEAREEEAGDDDQGEEQHRGAEGEAESLAWGMAEEREDSLAEMGGLAGDGEISREEILVEGGLGELDEGGGVVEMVVAGAEDELVAGALALDVEAAGDEPEEGVEEEEGFDEALEKVEDGVEAADVGQLVGEDGFDLLDGEIGGEGKGQEDCGAEEADEDGCGDLGAVGESGLEFEAEERHLAGERL